MGEMRAFSIALWVVVLLIYLFSGGRFLDWVFELPDVWQIDDTLIALVDQGDQMKQRLGLNDWFGDLRHWLHGVLGV